ncbi:MAG: HEPN domain-containing protein [Candidatus Poribacteria bacterium]|nr:HEPN domain-containing protein [Candidatus Poribacteria bacterium]MDE0465822.1 HEPN domain-containing protein [Candidatus Poribacteria bacterium]
MNNDNFISIMTERIVRDFDPLQIILFGSQARGDADPDSDIDLLVVFAELSDKRKTAVDILRTLADLPVAKDILVSTPEELERHRTRIGSVLRYAQQEGKILCGKDLHTSVGGSTEHRVLPNGEEEYSMQVNDRFQSTSRWLHYAEEDLITAETFLRHPHVPPRQCCWFAQQAAEKVLKAVLIFLEIDFPRTHDLNILRNLVPDGWHLKTAHPDLSDLTRWAAESRYPEDVPETTNADASEAVEQARGVWTSASTELAKHGYDVKEDL